MTNLILGCGIAFELPVLCFVLAKMGIVTGTLLKKYFKFAFVIILVAAAVITPSPDWTSQLLVAVPLYFYIGLVFFWRQRLKGKEQKNE